MFFLFMYMHQLELSTPLRNITWSISFKRLSPMALYDYLFLVPSRCWRAIWKNTTLTERLLACPTRLVANNYGLLVIWYCWATQRLSTWSPCAQSLRSVLTYHITWSFIFQIASQCFKLQKWSGKAKKKNVEERRCVWFSRTTFLFFVFRIASGAIRKKQKKGGESVLSDRKHTTRRRPRMQAIGGGKTKKAIWKSQRTRRIEYQKLSREMTMTIS